MWLVALAGWASILGSSAHAQSPNLDVEGKACRHEGLIASGYFMRSIVSGRSGSSPVEYSMSEFLLVCESREIVLSRARDGQSPLEHWRVVDISRDSVGTDQRLRFTFSRLGGVNMIASLHLSDLDGIRAPGAFPVVFLMDLSSAVRQNFGRLSFVAPAYRREIPLPRSAAIDG